jgi:hypothetical protein
MTRRIDGWVALLALLGVAACGRPGRLPGAMAQVESAADAVAAQVGQACASRPVVWYGVRDDAGLANPATRAWDRHLVSALTAAGTDLRWPDTTGTGASWGSEESLPQRLWRATAAGMLVAGGRWSRQGEWGYLRLTVVDPAGGAVAMVASVRARGAAVQALAERPSGGDGRPGPAVLSAEVHRLALRSEGGLTRVVELAPEAVLQPGDRLQVRVRSRQDAYAWAFLYSSDGSVTEVLPSRRVFADRWEYGPGQDTWVTLGEEVQVYTLYLVLAPRLPDDRSELWQRLAERVEQGQVVRYSGLDLLDAQVRSFLGRAIGDPAAVVWLRQAPTEPGPRTDFLLADGTKVSSQAEILTGGSVLVRAISFSVQ